MRAIIPQVFTGLVQASAQVLAVDDTATLRRLTLSLDALHRQDNLADDPIRPGDSVAINGACLTAVGVEPQSVRFDVIPETLARTNLRALAPGDLVHIERALRIGDRLDGHFVQGHIDGVAELITQLNQEDDWRLRIATPRALAKYFAPKGSITVDGVSLTIASLADDWFEVALIPATRQLTHLTHHAPGYAFNIECDMIGKTVVRFLELR